MRKESVGMCEIASQGFQRPVAARGLALLLDTPC